MKKKSHKISQLERLQMQRIKLQSEANTHWSALDSHWDYLQDNLGSLVLASTINTAKSKLPPVIAGLIPSLGEKNIEEKNDSRSKPSRLSASTEVLLDLALDAVPFLFKGRKSVIIALVLKKIKNLFF